MYNHYTPQSDGSYHRSTIPEPNRRPTQRHSPPHPEPQKPEPPQKPTPPPPPPKPQHLPAHEHCEKSPPPNKDKNLFSFLRGLLPREIDSIDLMVILLLILMNQEEDSDGISPILTLALYFLL